MFTSTPTHMLTAPCQSSRVPDPLRRQLQQHGSFTGRYGSVDDVAEGAEGLGAGGLHAGLAVGDVAVGEAREAVGDVLAEERDAGLILAAVYQAWWIFGSSHAYRWTKVATLPTTDGSRVASRALDRRRHRAAYVELHERAAEGIDGLAWSRMSVISLA